MTKSPRSKIVNPPKPAAPFDAATYRATLLKDHAQAMAELQTFQASVNIQGQPILARANAVLSELKVVNKILGRPDDDTQA